MPGLGAVTVAEVTSKLCPSSWALRSKAKSAKPSFMGPVTSPKMSN